MATLRSDLIIPEVFTPYLSEASTLSDSFLQSGVVQPLPELNLSAERGGDFVKIPNYVANLTGDFEVLTDSTSLTPAKITADSQVAPVLHRGRAFSSRDLASLAVGGGLDPMAAIAQKMAIYVNNQKQKDLYSCLQGAFGSLNANSSSSALFTHCIDSESGDTPTVLSPRHVAKAQSILGDAGSKLTTIAMHSKTFYDLVERNAIDRIYDNTGSPDSDATGGSTTRAFDGPTAVNTFMGLNVIVSDDIPTTGGTVTQASNKSTGVTLNTESGQITMNNAQLDAGTEVTFTVTNSKIAATDVVVACHGSAGTAGSYLVNANAIAAGSFAVTVSNVSAGNLSEAIVINFVALKGASS